MASRSIGVWVATLAWGTLAFAQGASPVATIRGKVLLSDGKPAAGAEIVYVHSDDPAGSRRQVKADEQGQYELKDVRADAGSGADPFASGGGELAVTPAPGQPGEVPVQKFSVPAGGALTKDLAFLGDLELSGTVVDLDTGKPLPGIHLMAQAQPGGMKNVISDEQGRFKFAIRKGARVSVQFHQRSDMNYMFDEQFQHSPRFYQPLHVERMTADRTNQVMQAKLQKTRAVSGKVVDDAGKPVAGAQVMGDPRTILVQTASDGTFSLKAVLAGQAQIAVIAGNQGALANISDSTDKIDITVRPLETRACIVTTPDGLPAANLTFTLVPQVAGKDLYPLSSQVKTDAQGKCQLTKVLPGVSYRANWHSTGTYNREYDYGNATINLAQLKGDEPARFVARQYTKTLSGKVVDSEGNPVAKAVIGSRSSQLVRNNRMGREDLATTAADGTFKIDQLAAGTMELTITAPNYRKLLVQAATTDTAFTATLHRSDEPAERKVVIQTTDGKPVADTGILVLSEQDDQLMPGNHETDAQGMVSLDDVTPNATLLCNLPGYGISLFQPETEVEGVQRMVVRKVEQPWKVRVLGEDGKPVVGQRVKVRSVSNVADGESNYFNHVSVPQHATDEQLELWGLIAKTDSEGRATFPRLAVGQYGEVAIDRPGLQPLNHSMNWNYGSTELLVTIRRPGKIEGKLILPEGANVPLNDANLQIQCHEANQFLHQRVDSDGTFRIDHAEPGTYRVSLHFYSRTGNATTMRYLLPPGQEITVKPGETAHAELRLKEGIAIRGKLKVDDSEEAEESRPSMVGVSGQGIGHMPTAEPDAEGNWTLYVPEPGKYQLMYLQPGKHQWMNDRTITVEADKPTEGIVITPK